MQRILSSRDTLITDYMGLGGVGAALVHAGLLTLAALAVYWRSGAVIGGAAVACLWLVLGFGLFGKNLLNVWGIVAGVWLYARYKAEPFAKHINTAFFGTALAPIFSEILFSSALALPDQPAAGRGDDRAARLRAGARGGAPVPCAPGALALQHGFRRRPAGHADGGGLQELRFRARPGVHLDAGQQPAAGQPAGGAVRGDGGDRLCARPAGGAARSCG